MAKDVTDPVIRIYDLDSADGERGNEEKPHAHLASRDPPRTLLVGQLISQIYEGDIFEEETRQANQNIELTAKGSSQIKPKQF